MSRFHSAMVLVSVYLAPVALNQSSVDGQPAEPHIVAMGRTITPVTPAESTSRKARETEASKSTTERDQLALRAQLLKRFDATFAAQDTSRGLVFNLGDVLFDTGKFDLRPAGEEALAKLSAIVRSHPGLRVQVEGHTDSVGGEESNRKLSQQRAEEVRDYLLSKDLPPDTVLAKGFGQTMPIASNDSPEGRQRNRRVEIIVSGQAIGAQPVSPQSRAGR